MKISVHQLSSHLQNNLAPIYIVAGDDLFLVEETRKKLIQAAKEKGFNDRQILEAAKDFNWQQFALESKNFSLLCSKTILDLRLTHKPNATGNQILAQYSENPPEEKMLILTMAKPDAGTQKSTWFQAMGKKAALIQIWPLNSGEFQKFIQQRLRDLGLIADTQGIKILVELTEGNLLAADQEIQKLGLLYGEGKLSADQIFSAIHDSARFDVYALINAIHLREKERSIRILTNLLAEGHEPLLILWSIVREIRLLISMHVALSKGNNLADVFKQHGIWEKKQTELRKSLQHTSLKKLHTTLISAQKIDLLLKGALNGDRKQALINFVMEFFI